MRLIVAPAKKMRINDDALASVGKPVLLEKTRRVLTWLRGRTPEELQKMWDCSDKIAQEGMDYLDAIDLDRAATPAMLAYDGIQYKYMAPSVFDENQIDYVQEHLRILSGFYGVLRALDPVGRYRLELNQKAPVEGCHDLYAFWGSDIHDEVVRGDQTVINLASLEYSRAVKSHLQPGERFVDIVFGQEEKGKVVTKGVYAKMARGEMVRYAADVQATAPEDLIGFDRLGYTYRNDLSSDDRFVYTN